MAHEDEAEAFRNFLDVFPEQSTLLIDTYDVLADSLWARHRLDTVGWNDVQIFISGDLDENRIEALLQGGARIDAFGVGTALSTSADASSVGVIYKLVEIEAGGSIRSTAKLSEAKKTYPGRKQVFRFSSEEGTFSGDVIGLEDERFPAAEPLLVPVIRHGRRLEPALQEAATTARVA